MRQEATYKRAVKPTAGTSRGPVEKVGKVAPLGRIKMVHKKFWGGRKILSGAILTAICLVLSSCAGQTGNRPDVETEQIGSKIEEKKDLLYPLYRTY